MSHVISNFYGMTIMMNSDRNDSQPHFEVFFHGQISKFFISNGKMYAGNLIAEGQEIIPEW